MKTAILSGILFAVALNLCLLGGTAHAAPPATTQILTLQPGWNSVYLDVQPEETDPGAVFSALPEESSVWHWYQRNSKKEYILNPNEGLWDQPGWLAYYKSNQKIFLSTLYAIFADRAYLIFVAGSSGVTIPVTGVPSVKKTKWTADSFNLAGFSVAPAGEQQITFAQYFSASKAHAGQAIYTLDTAGQWTLISDPATTNIQPGKAYWVYCEGVSTYQGYLDISFPTSEGFTFNNGVVQQTFIIHNRADETREVSFRLLTSNVALTYKDYDESAAKFIYPPVDNMGVLSLAPDKKRKVTLGVRLEDMPDGEAGSILVIKDNSGIFIQVPVWFDRGVEIASQQSSIQPLATDAASPGTLSPGLWAGSAKLNMVSQSNQRGADFYFDLQVIGRKDDLTLLAEGEDWTRWRAYNHPEGEGWRIDPQYVDTDSETITTPDNYGSIYGTWYYRKTFTPPDLTERHYTDITFRLKVDDGAAVYFNGKLIYVYNLTSLDHEAAALTEVDARYVVREFTVPITMLLQGENLVAVQVHQYTPDNPSDHCFSLEIKASFTDVLLPFKSAGWHYYDETSAPPEDGTAQQWQTSNYSEDMDWEENAAPFAYLDDPPYNPNDLNFDSETIYFRKTLSVNPNDYDSLTARILYDDGAVFYSNGSEGRFNMPDQGTIEYETCPLAVRSTSEMSTYAEIPLNNLVNGENQLAVEVHQHAAEISGINANDAVPVPDSAALDLRLLLHVDENQTIRLLKEVIMMSTEDGDQVLLTDHEKIPDYDGVSWRDGTQVARRLSTSGFDFGDNDSAHPGSKELTVQGNILSGKIQLKKDHPGNPFLHRYHPDHDNLNARYEPIPDNDPHPEVPDITRDIQMDFITVWDGDPDAKPLGWGETIVEGVYSEIISGLHKNDISIKGDFTLHRVSDVKVLNP